MRLLNLLPWRRRRMERDLDRELRYHIDRRLDDLRQSGLSERDARRRAAIEFGGVVQAQEAVRDTWMWRWVDEASRDLRYAGRMALGSPGFTATALLSLALGIGANAAIFSLVDRVLLRPLPVAHPEQLVNLAWRGTSLSTGWGYGYVMSYPVCRELEEQKQVFDAVFCRHPGNVSLSIGKEPERVAAEIVTGSFFSTLGAQPVLGRLLDATDDEQPGAHPVVVLAHRYWRDRLGGAADVVGRKVLVNGYPMTVVGVAPEDFSGIDLHIPAVLWMPATMAEQAGNVDGYWNRLLDRRAAWLHAVARLKPGMGVEEAKAALQPWFRAMLEEETRRAGFPRVTAEQRSGFLASTLDVMPIPRGLSGVRGGLERPLWVLMAGTLLLLVLAALNVAGLLLARGAARARELTTRMAIGATRARIARQLLIEGLWISLAGALLGLLAAPAVSQLFLAVLSRDGDLGVSVDYRVIVFAALTTIATGALCGLVPALQVGRVPLIASLNERSRIAGGGVKLRKILVAGQMALTLILLVGAGLLVRTLAHLQTQVGFDSRNLFMVSLNPPANGYSAQDAERAMREVLEKLRAVPTVEHASVANSTLLSGGTSTTSITIQAAERFAVDRGVSRMRVGPGFFATLGTRIVAGRDFDERDLRPPGSKPRPYQSIIVNETFARRIFNGQNPIGARLGLGNRPDTPTNIEIIGVVQDFSRRTLRDGEYEQMFLQFWDQASEDGTFYVRVRGDAATAAAPIRAAIAEVDATLPVSLTAFDNQIGLSLRTERMLATLSSVFSGVALLLAVVGLYGVMSFVVTQRTQEIGVRMALGATRVSALWLIIRDASVMIGSGAVVALPSLWGLKQLVESQLFGVKPFDAPTLAIAGTLLALVALGAAMLPAWRAASVSPTEALRL
jgi:predicted permease